MLAGAVVFKNRARVGLVVVVGLREVRMEGEMVDKVLVWVWRTERRRMVERSDILRSVLLKNEGRREHGPWLCLSWIQR